MTQRMTGWVGPLRQEWQLVYQTLHECKLDVSRATQLSMRACVLCGVVCVEVGVTWSCEGLPPGGCYEPPVW